MGVAERRAVFARAGWQRPAAWLADAALVVAAWAALLRAAPGLGEHRELLFPAFVVYRAVAHALFAKTAGKALAEVRVVDWPGGGRASAWQCVRRELLPLAALLAGWAGTALSLPAGPAEVAAAWALFLLDAGFALVAPSHRALHDYLGGTAVIHEVPR